MTELKLNHLLNAKALEKVKIKKGEILNYLQDNPNAFAVDIAAALDISTPAVREELQRLVDNGVIKVFSSPTQSDLSSGGLIYRCV